MSFRKIVQREAQRQGLSGYRIAQLASMPMRTVQAYLAGERDLTGERVARIAAVLGLGLKRVRRSKRSRPGRSAKGR